MSTLSIPPWLNVSPGDFVKAAQMGAEAGLSVARLRQAAEEAAANRDQSAQEFNARMQQAKRDEEFKHWEAQQANALAAQKMQQQAELSGATLGARTAYNLANLSLRDRTATANEQYRQSQSSRLAGLADLQRQAEARRVQEEKRRQGAADSADKKWLVKEEIRALYDKLKLETDPATLEALKAQIAQKAQELAAMTGNPADAGGAAGPGSAPPPGAPPDLSRAASGFQPGMTFTPDINAPDGMPAPTSDVPPPPQAPPTPAAGPAGTDWQPHGKYKIRLVQPEATPQNTPAPTGTPPAAVAPRDEYGYDAETYEPMGPPDPLNRDDEENPDEEDK